MQILAEQGFTPAGTDRQTVLRVCQVDDGRFILQEIPFDTVSPVDQVFASMHEAVAAMKARIAKQKGDARAKHLPPDPKFLPKKQPGSTPPSRFDRDDVL